MAWRATISGLVLLAAVGTHSAGGQHASQAGGREPRSVLLSPLPAHGGVPPIVDRPSMPSEDELARRAAVRQYATQIRAIRRRCFGSIRVAETREAGFAELREFTDPASFRPMLTELGGEDADVRRAVLSHLGGQGDEGQAALAWSVIHGASPVLSEEPVTWLVALPPPPVLRVLDDALRSRNHEIANRAGMLAGSLRAVETVPLLMFAMATADAPQDTGDLAWIAIETQEPFVAGLEAVVGEGAGAFQPVVGLLHEGIVLRVMDAVVVVYRTEIHRALVEMTSEDWGSSTAHLGYDMNAWWTWYNTEFVPHKIEQRRILDLARLPGAEPEPDE